MSGLIWIQTVWHLDGISERIFQKSWFWKKSADNVLQAYAKYPEGKEFNKTKVTQSIAMFSEMAIGTNATNSAEL